MTVEKHRPNVALSTGIILGVGFPETVLPRACSLLLVDGYDEIGTEDQKRVSEAILAYQRHLAGKLYLTCRDSYEISNLPPSPATAT